MILADWKSAKVEFPEGETSSPAVPSAAEGPLTETLDDGGPLLQRKVKLNIIATTIKEDTCKYKFNLIGRHSRRSRLPNSVVVVGKHRRTQNKGAARQLERC